MWNNDYDTATCATTAAVSSTTSPGAATTVDTAADWLPAAETGTGL